MTWFLLEELEIDSLENTIDRAMAWKAVGGTRSMHTAEQWVGLGGFVAPMAWPPIAQDTWLRRYRELPEL